MKTTTDIQEASNWIKEGKVIAYPTEGIWGLGGLNTSQVIKALDLIKRRPKDKKYILLFPLMICCLRNFRLQTKSKILLQTYLKLL